MPELAEVETVRRDLTTVALGQTFQSVTIHGPRTVRRHSSAVLTDQLPDRKITGLRRLGKYLLIDLDDRNVLLVHLRMSGQLLWKQDRNGALEKHTHARMFFSGGAELRFVDPRTFGELWLSPPELASLDHIGPDALNDLAEPEDFAARFSTRKSGLKALLLNQQVVAGIGNIYSDEILWEAQLHYGTSPRDLGVAALEGLHGAMKTVLARAVEARGSSLADEQYVDLFGAPGGAQAHLNVYAREHEPCQRCEHPIRRMKFGGRSTFFCPNCQRSSHSTRATKTPVNSKGPLA